MKYLKSFKQLNERIIMPKEFDSEDIRTIEDLKLFAEKEDFDIVNYDEFYNSLSDKDRKTAPPRGVPFFALFHSIRKKPMLVLNGDPMQMLDGILDIMRHEFIHKEQARRSSKIEYELPEPLNRKAYFSDKNEIMAFSFSLANNISKNVDSFEDAIEMFKSERFTGMESMMWRDIKSNVDEKVYRRYVKYIYMYLEEMFKEVSE